MTDKLRRFVTEMRREIHVPVHCCSGCDKIFTLQPGVRLECPGCRHSKTHEIGVLVFKLTSVRENDDTRFKLL